MQLRPYQDTLVNGIFDAWSRVWYVAAVLPTGGGKCLGRGTPILMFDGTIRRVEEIRTGDLLMGPDSTPRRVLSTCRGQENLYRVIPTKGDPYIVNQSHILSLRRTNRRSAPQYPSERDSDEIINISVTEYLARSATFRREHKGWRSPVNFVTAETPLPLDPYFLGLWLGDGTSRSPSITTGDTEVMTYLQEYAVSLGMNVRYEPNSHGSLVAHITVAKKGPGGNKVMTSLRKLGVIQNKHIPLSYKTASRDARLQVLAGLLDSDGSYTGKGFDLIQKDEQLLDDAIYIARSLGFAAYKKPSKKVCGNNSRVGQYWRCSISGDIEKIPTRVTRKKASLRRQKKNVLRVGLRVESLGTGDYYGFEIDGDHLFMLGDFTVTHNTVIYSHIVANDRTPSVVIAHRSELVSQTSLALVRNRVRHRIIGQKPLISWCHRQSIIECGHSYIDHNAPCAVISVDTLVRMNASDPWFRSVRLWVCDECFPAGTLVDGRPIETLRVGDNVTTFDERTGQFTERPVTRVFKSPMPTDMVRLHTRSHHVLECTLGHPFWTRRGWVNAGELTADDEVLIHEVLHMQSSTGGYPPAQDAVLQNDGAGVLRPGVFVGLSQANILPDGGPNQPPVRIGADESPQPDAKERDPRKSQSDITPDRARPRCSWRQWTSILTRGFSALYLLLAAWFRPGVRGADREENLEQISDSLQNRSRPSSPKDSDRSRWIESSRPRTPETGSQERKISYWTRVDCVEIYKSDSSDGIGNSAFVYNLEVADFHTYTANGIVVHNCHHLQRDNKWGKAISMFPHARGLGVTATLERADGCGLGDPDGFLQEIVVGPSMRQLINDGYLSDFRVLAPPNDINLRDIPIGDSGDFSQAPLRRAVHNSHIVGDVVQHYLRFVPGKLGVTFCVDIESAAEMCQAYRQAGVTAEVVTGKTPAEARANLMRRFGNGEFRQLCVVDVVSEGTDIPAIDCVSLARPSASYVTVVQQIGRALRTSPGKDKAVILDHVGNVARFARVGYCPVTQRSTIELDRATWSLARRERRRRNSPEDVQPIRVCPMCLADYPATEGRVCPYCNHYEPPAGRASPDQVDGDLAELDPEALRQLASQVVRVDGAPVFPVGMAPEIQGAIAKRHRERQEAQGALRQAMMLWGGARLAEGMSLRQAQRVFFHTFGVDVMTAQTLGRPEAEELTPRVLNGLNVREAPR